NPYDIAEWNKTVTKVKSRMEKHELFSLESGVVPSQLLRKSYRLRNVRWRYIGESCAAGLPYLRSTRVKEEPGLPGLRKLLVVDVGAGSTDIGYMIKTVEKETGRELVHYLPPAGVCTVAGDN